MFRMFRMKRTMTASSFRPFNAIIGFVGLIAVAPAFALAGAVDFNREVRPILSGNCFKCHGADDASRKAGLRLDEQAAAYKGGKSGEPAIVPHQPDKSELI